MNQYSHRTEVQSFWDKTERAENGCLVWTGGTNGKKGYGIHWKRREKKWSLAHRWAYEHFIGPIPEGLVIDHLCFNVKCVEPKHLEAVTPLENHLRSNSITAVLGRRESCQYGHLYDAKNTYRWKGARYCRKCRARRERNRKARIRVMNAVI